MAGRLSVVCVSFLAVLAFLLLFASGTHVDAATYKMGYSSELSCAGPDGFYPPGDVNADTVDDALDNSCVEDATFGARGAGLHADLVSYFDVYAGHSMYSLLATMGTPSTWQISTDKAIPNGAYVGDVVALSTLGLFGGECVTLMEVTFEMHDCSTDITNTIDWNGAISGENLTYGHKDGLPAGCLKYPQHVLDIVGDVQPRARYYGFTTVLNGMPPTQLQFMMFNPERLSSLPAPRADFSDDLGYINFTVLDNPDFPAEGDSALDELCTPLGTTTNLLGLTGGEAVLTQDVGPGTVPPDKGTFWKVGVQPGPVHNPPTFIDEFCGNDTDDDGDTRTDEMCGIVRVTNPGVATVDDYADCDLNEDGDCEDPGPPDETTLCANGEDDDDDDVVDDGCPTGIYGTGSHMAGGYSESYRDADGDTIANNQDECPFTVDYGCTNCDNNTDDDAGDAGENMAGRRINDGCAAFGLAETECDEADCPDDDGTPGAPPWATCDNDSDGYINDGCPTQGTIPEGDNDADHISNACDPTPNVSTGPPPLYQDHDFDGFRNQADNCPLDANPDQSVDTDDDSIGDVCDTLALGNGPDVPDGHYANDLAWGSICIEATDTDGDGWCDATEDIDGYLGPGNPISDKSVKASVPEWRALDALVRAEYNPPGAAPGTCSNRDWYDTHRLGGPETDDDADGSANMSDANACPGMNLDLTSAPSTIDPLVLNCPDVVGSLWHELWPNYSTTYEATSHADDDGDTTLSQGDQIDFDDGHDYHVDEVTITLWLSLKPDLVDVVAVEWYASAEDMQDAYHNPVSTQWHEIWPVFSNEYHLEDWDDTGSGNSGYLGTSDQITLRDKDTDVVVVTEWHVDEVTIDIIVTQKPDGDTDGDGVLDDGDGSGTPGDNPCTTGETNCDDNCPNTWNPTQLDTDSNCTLLNPMRTCGDACDMDDDADNIIDSMEWAAGSDPKNICDPRNFDVTGNGVINVLDVSAFGVPMKPVGRDCNPPKDYTICEEIYRSDQ